MYFLFGASGHGKVIKEIVEANGEKLAAFIDDNPLVSEVAGVKVLHGETGLSPVIVSIGENSVRKKVVGRLSGPFGMAIHPSAVVSPSARIGEGTVVMAGAVVNADAVIGKHCIINTGASVDHECVVGDYCHIAPHAALCGQIHIGEGTLVGAGSCVIPCINIGAWCTIGAGAAVVNNIPDNMKVIGVPARDIRAMKKSEGGGNVSLHSVVNQKIASLSGCLTLVS